MFVCSSWIYQRGLSCCIYTFLLKMCQETQGNERREYPVVRAQKLNHEIKKLGSNESGHSYMDQFRMLIAEIGNALGFVRMVRLGGLSYSSLASGYASGSLLDTSFKILIQLLLPWSTIRSIRLCSLPQYCGSPSCVLFLDVLSGFV